jgi:hypothetical protein
MGRKNLWSYKKKKKKEEEANSESTLVETLKLPRQISFSLDRK